MPARLAVPLLTLALGTVLWFTFGGVAVVNYDTLYALLWGDQLLAAEGAELRAAAAPTPHPLLTLAGLLGAPLVGDASAGQLSVVAWLGYMATAACAVLLGLVAKRSLGAAAAVIAAVLLITREPVLSYGLRAYIDLPYLALLLAALALELGERRRGTPVLVCLLLAGLLRPEAWLLSAAYAAWLSRGGAVPGVRMPDLRPLWVATALAAPVLWALTDLLLTGDPLFSFTGTRAGTERLERPTGLSGLVEIAPRRVGEILRWELLLGALAGAALLLWRRTAEQWRVLAAATLAAALAFAAVAIGGLPVIVRYLLPLAAAGCLAAALALTGWRCERSIPLGRVWAVGAALLAVLILGFAPRQADRLDRLQAALAAQQRTIDELRVLTAGAPCGPYAVPNRRAVPLLALWTGERTDRIRTTQDEGAPDRGTYFVPATPAAARGFVLDARDRERAIPPVPRGFTEQARTSRWVMASRCG